MFNVFKADSRLEGNLLFGKYERWRKYLSCDKYQVSYEYRKRHLFSESWIMLEAGDCEDLDISGFVGGYFFFNI